MNKKAFLVGINAYPSAPLNGCLNDVSLIRGVLESQFFSITTLTDSAATRSAVLLGLKNLVRNAKAGDVLVWHFSGHGSQVTATGNHTEADGLDEVICVYDDIIRDTELNAIFRTVPPGVHLLAIHDCCFSGTSARGSCDSRPRCMPRIVYRAGMFDWLIDLWKRIFGKEEKPVRPFTIATTEQGETILLTACNDQQTAADAFIGGVYNGAFTACLVRALRELQFNAGYKAVVRLTTEKIRSYGFEQTPQLECRAEYFDRGFLR